MVGRQRGRRQRERSKESDNADECELAVHGFPTSVAECSASIPTAGNEYTDGWQGVAASGALESRKQLIEHVSGHQPDSKQQCDGAQDCRTDPYGPP